MYNWIHQTRVEQNRDFSIPRFVKLGFLSASYDAFIIRFVSIVDPFRLMRWYHA